MAAISRAAIARAAATSCTMMALGDCVTQELSRRKAARARQSAVAAAIGSKGSKRGKPSAVDSAVTEQQPHDWARTARFALIGAGLHGPFFAAGLAWLDGLFPGAATPATVAKKVLTGQLTLFPIYTTLFLITLRALEGTPLAELPARLDRERGQLGETIARGSVFWPLVNVVNFSVVPQGNARIFAMNTAGIFWNSYLSYSTQEKGRGGAAEMVGRRQG
jgi:hypothetical protein